VKEILSPKRESMCQDVLERRCSSAASVCRLVSLDGCERAEWQAREAVRDTCSEALGARLPDALLVVSELVANAVSHTMGVTGLMLRSDGGITKLTVLDRGGTSSRPRIADADPLAESGRGMRLVDALADSWHTRLEPDGKAVTAVFHSSTTTDRDSV